MIFNSSNITAIIVSYFRPERLLQCVDSLHLLDNIHVYDNCTKGKDLIKIKMGASVRPKVKFIYNSENLGCSIVFNKGIIDSETDWVLLTADDMIFDFDWMDIANDIIDKKPHLEQICLNSYNAILIHKKTIVRMGWWDEGYRYFPSMDDDDWYLRTVELLGYSYYGGCPPHLEAHFPIHYKEKILNENYLEKDFHDINNFVYFNNSQWSQHKIIGESTITDNENDAGSRNNIINQVEKAKGINGVQYHMTKWQQVSYDTPGRLVSKDCRCWVRIKDEIDYYPDIRMEYYKKYFK